jgi:hypothetical protein
VDRVAVQYQKHRMRGIVHEAAKKSREHRSVHAAFCRRRCSATAKSPHDGCRSNVKGLFYWLLTKHEWIKSHPVFEGLQRSGFLEYPYYRELLTAHQPRRNGGD